VTENFEYTAIEGKHSFYRLEISIFFLLSFSIATSTSLSINYKVTILQGRIDHKSYPPAIPKAFGTEARPALWSGQRSPQIEIACGYVF
jgi:hypothetical protein